jgi:hypothetical protein
MKVLSFLENQKNPFSCKPGIGSLKTPITFDGAFLKIKTQLQIFLPRKIQKSGRNVSTKLA